MNSVKETKRSSMLFFFAKLLSVALLLISTVASASENSERNSNVREGEFIAGSFILTQKSLNEAPYRYAGVLRKALDTVETKDPPSRSDEV